MANLLHRFIVVGDLHGDSDASGSNFTPVSGADWRTVPSPSPSTGSGRMEMMRDRVLKEINDNQVDFVYFIGDILTTGNGGLSAFQNIKSEYMSDFGVPIYASYGNHDRISNEDWEEVWGHSRDHEFSLGNYGFINLNSSNEAGARDICISQPFLETALEKHKGKAGVFFFSHIPRFKGGFRGDPVTSPQNYGADSPQCNDIMDLLADQDNLVCMVHGHFHEFNSVFMHRNIPVVFTGHMAYYGVNYYNLCIFEVYDDGSIYVFHDGFTGIKVDGAWQYTEQNKTFFNLKTKFKKSPPIVKTVEGGSKFYIDRYNSF